MKALLALSRFIDAINEHIGRSLYWLVLVMTLISAGNAVARYGFNLSSNAFFDIQWFLFSIVFLGTAGYTLKHNQHVRIDLITARLSKRAQAWIDVFGGLFMLLPVCAIIFWYGWTAALEAWRIQEGSLDAGGLPRWPIKFMVPLAFLLLMLQGVSETIRRVAFLKGLVAEDTEHHAEIDEHVKILKDRIPGEQP